VSSLREHSRYMRTTESQTHANVRARTCRRGLRAKIRQPVPSPQPACVQAIACACACAMPAYKSSVCDTCAREHAASGTNGRRGDAAETLELAEAMATPQRQRLQTHTKSTCYQSGWERSKEKSRDKSSSTGLECPQESSELMIAHTAYQQHGILNTYFHIRHVRPWTGN
jgi:hypothetical protein